MSIMLTASFSKEERDQVASEGANAFIINPISVQDWIKAAQSFTVGQNAA
jgi:hypothetical protein